MLSKRAIVTFVCFMDLLIDQGHENKVREGIVRLLLNEKVKTDLSEFRELLARLIAPRRKGQGRPSKKRTQALMLGLKNEILQIQNIGPEPVRFDLISKQMNISSSTAERGITHYRQNKTKTNSRAGRAFIDGRAGLLIPGTTCEELMSTLLETEEILLIAFPGKEYEFLARSDEQFAEFTPIWKGIAEAAGKKDEFDEFLATRDQLLAGLKAPPKQP